jgi:Fic family protein
LPPAEIDLGSLVNDVTRATLALGELSGIGRAVSNPFLLIRPFMRREAVASSKIEGTVTTLTELLLFEVEQNSSRNTADTREVMNYVRALETSLTRLDELPVCVRMIKDAHKILLRSVSKQRGASIVPGEFRKDQNWIGARTLANARFVPPPPQEVEPAMSELEKYINNMDGTFPLLINLALIHYQFETIHPFPDGNGRVGRLLMPLILCEQKQMSQPLLYLSAFFEKRYDEYIENMLNVSKGKGWEQWVRFFLLGVEESANEAIIKTKKLQDLQREYYSRIQQARTSALLGRVIESLFSHPALTVPIVATMLSISYNAAKSHIERLIQHGILAEAEYYYYPKAYVAKEIINVMNE